MSPVYLSPQQHSSSMPFLELRGDHHHVVATNNNAYFSHSNFDHNSSGIQAIIDYDHSRRAQEKIEKLMVISQTKQIDVGDQILACPQQLQYTQDGSGCSYNYPFDHQNGSIDQTANVNLSKKCKPTKLRIMHKMTANSNKSKITRDDHNHDLAKPNRMSVCRNTGNNEISNGFIRVCTDCHTTTTPLWRSGPLGPKSLCNACGIRQRKARRAAMAAAEAANNTTVSSSSSSPLSASSYIESSKPKLVTEEMIKPERKLDDPDDMITHALPIKKRSKMSDRASWNSYIINNNNNNNNNNNGRDRVSFRDFASSDQSQTAFPRDEEEGAILLMALSSGLPCSS